MSSFFTNFEKFVNKKAQISPNTSRTIGNGIEKVVQIEDVRYLEFLDHPKG